MKDLLEKLDWIFAGHKKGQKDADQVRGHEKFDMISPVLGEKPKKHPAHGRLVGGGGGSAEEYEESVEQIAEQLRKELAEYGAAGGAISGGDDDSREQVAAMRRDQKAQADQTDAQEDGLEAQLNSLKRQMTDIKKSPEPIPNPRDPASIMQTAAAKADKREQVKSIALQMRDIAQQLGQFGE